MTLGEPLDKMLLNTHSAAKLDPVAEALIKGKAPALGDVKQFIKVGVSFVFTLFFGINLLLHPESC
jgi:hypothetical protein